MQNVEIKKIYIYKILFTKYWRKAKKKQILNENKEEK